MANDITFTALAPIMYKSMDSVLREQIGAIPAVMLNSSGATEAAQGDVVKSLRVTDALDKSSYTPAMSIPDAGDKTNVMDSFSINQYVGKELPIKGEIAKRLGNINEYGKWVEDEFAQMIRAAMNEIEAYLLGIIYKGSSRAVGTAGTTPFSSNLNQLNALRKVLQDNGCPLNDRMLSFVMDSSAGLNMRNLTALSKVNESGDSSLLRRGILGDLSGFMIRESAGVNAHTKGTGTGYLIDVVDAIGATTLAVDTGSGTVLAGDVISLAGQDGGAGEQDHKYVVNTGIAAAGDIVINRPGLRFASVDNEAVTVGGNYTANVGFHRNAVELALRAPALPQGGDVSVDRMIMVDPLTQIPLEFRLYKGYGMNKIELNIFYDAIVWKPEMVATLLG